MVAVTVQLNVRMDSQLRAAGDAVLERVGVTPADVVRALWAKIAEGVQDCEQVLAYAKADICAKRLFREGGEFTHDQARAARTFAWDCATQMA